MYWRMKVTGCSTSIAAIWIILLSIAASAAPAGPACDDPVGCVDNCRQVCNMQTVAQLNAAILEGFATNAGANITVPVAMATLTKDVVVRSVPFGVFASKQNAAEYFGIENGYEGLSKVIRFTGGYPWGFSVQNQVAMGGVDLGLENVDSGLQTNVSVIVLYTLTNVSKIQYISVNFLRFPEALQRINASESLAKQEVIDYTRNYICDIHEQYCTGAKQQYSNRTDCIQFLETRPMINANYDLGGNNNICRLLHATLVHTAPALHCPHIGPTGGKACVDGIFDSPESFHLFPLGSFVAANPV